MISRTVEKNREISVPNKEINKTVISKFLSLKVEVFLEMCITLAINSGWMQGAQAQSHAQAQARGPDLDWGDEKSSILSP